MAWNASTVQHFDTGWADFNTVFTGPFNVRKCDTVWTWSVDVGSPDTPTHVNAYLRANGAVYGFAANTVFNLNSVIGARVIGNATGLFQTRIIPGAGPPNAFIALDFFGMSGTNSIPKLLASILSGEIGQIKDVDVNLATVDIRMIALRFS